MNKSAMYEYNIVNNFKRVEFKKYLIAKFVIVIQKYVSVLCKFDYPTNCSFF